MDIGWNSSASSFVRTAVDALLRPEHVGSDAERAAARATHALPVYLDLGGALCFTTEGGVLHYDWGTETAEPEHDRDWILVAAVAAAEKYPALADILPARPATAETCSRCHGSGRPALTRDLRLRCGKCFGLGWV
jgi:hypothetical protein